ncbi:MAG: glycoside hydrolase family 127 protein [Armatimonadetes bacterium]|nr:glycoside hydrolase family 127 protein [Armatimonadota bacterium]
MDRRQFIRLSAGAALTPALARMAGAVPKMPRAIRGKMRASVKLQPFDYQGVRLLDGPLQDRMRATREFYLAIPDDDILRGFRRKAGLPAPGRDMGGWCNDTSAVTFGQWLSGMARLSGATDDAALRDKAALLMTGWGETLPRQTFGHYDYDKFVCGLVDMAQYAGHPDALPLLARLTNWAEQHLSRDRLNATDADSQGGFFNGQMEWYTLPENLYRAYLLTGDARYKEFGDVWRYPHYWGMFNGQVNATPDGFHAYSHVNTLSSAALCYAVTGDPQYLKTITGAYDYFQRTQCYATGGYGPGEKLMPPDGALGESIVVEPNAKYLSGTVGRSFETPCGTWAVFKLTRYLQQFTGEAHYGDWMERVLYNGIGAALPMRGRGETFYYADYRMPDGRKYYFGAPWPCCSGTYIQDVADFHNILYYHDDVGLFVNLYVPSEVTWTQHGQPVTLTQETRYPEEGMVTCAVQMAQPADFALRFRVPGWAQGTSAQVNGVPVPNFDAPGAWAVLHRRWRPGDRVTLHIPLSTRPVPIDAQHPQRVAFARGPVVLVRPHDSPAPLPTVPFSQVTQDVPYSMYFDAKA